MALTWSVKECADWEALTTDEVFPFTESLLFRTMAIGIGHWTEKRLPEILVRLQFADLDEYRYEENDEIVTRRLTLDDLRPYVGLRTNVAYETPAKWRKRIYESKLSDMEYRARRKKETV